MSYQKKTKIVCTLGPASDSVQEIIRLIQSGMNVARLNFSHGSHAHHKKIIDNLRLAEQKTGKTVAILADLQGPKIRVGKTKEQIIRVKKDQEISLPLATPQIIKDLKIGDHVLVDDGLVELIITKKLKTRIKAKALNSGVIKTGNGMNFPDSKITLPAVTEKDKQDLAFILEQKLDLLALSFVKDKQDITTLKKLIKGKHKPQIIAKIERHQAVGNLSNIIKAADGVMVARGDLGVDIPQEQVPIVQKRIIAIANHEAKPVITATQVLQSMVKKARATRAEISDAANAVFDHTDAIMLSNETAVGRYPFRATETLSKVAIAIEQEIEKHPELKEHFFPEIRHQYNSNPCCKNATDIANESNADLIVNFTTDGYTAKQLAKFRSSTPIITFTNKEQVKRDLQLVWGLNDIFLADIPKKHPNKARALLELTLQKIPSKKKRKIIVIISASKEENISTFTL